MPQILFLEMYRKYTEEFKLEALELLKSSGKSAGQIERDLGITPGLLVKWRDGYQVISKGIDQVHRDFEAAKREIKHLQRRLEEEREILKKTINIFCRKSHQSMLPVFGLAILILSTPPEKLPMFLFCNGL